jgi:hypothetical protein
MNSEWMAEAATKMAQSLSDQLSEQLSEQQGTDNDTWIVRLFERVLSRAPNPSELNACRDYLGKQSRAELALVLLNTNEFAFVP